MRSSFGRLKELHHHLQELLRDKLWAKVMAGMALGVAFGFLIGPSVGWVDPQIANIITEWLAFPGGLFLGLVKMIVIPLIISSIIIGINSSGDMEKLRLMGAYIVGYFVFTTTIAISIGIGMAYLIQPGRYIGNTPIPEEETVPVAGATELPGFAIDNLPDMIVGLLPENPLSSMVSGELLSIVIFTIIIGIALLTIRGETAAPLLKLLEALQEVCITIVKWAMKLVPFAVFGMMSRLTSTTGGETLIGMGVYIATVLTGLLILVLFYGLIIAFIARRNPLIFLRKIKDVQLLAFSTSSSAAVMPISIKTAEDQLSVSPGISQFVIPVGATINMDGTALYQGVATVFLAQVYGIELSVGALVLVVVTATAASIGAPSAPGVGIVVLASVLQSVGIPAAGIALIISVDRILDMSRTTVNVTGDLTGSLVFQRWFGKGMNPAARPSVNPPAG